MRCLRRMPTNPDDQPGEQRRDHPQGRRGPAAAPCLGAPDRGHRLGRQHQAVAGDGVELLGQDGGAPHERRQAARAMRPSSRTPSAASSSWPAGPRWRSIHSRTTGSATVHMSSLGSSPRATPFDHHHGLLQEQQLRARAHVEQAGDLEQQHQELRHRDVFGGAVVDRLADGADRLREALDRMLRRHVAGLEMHLGRALIIAGDEAVAGSRRGSGAPCGRAGP